MPITPSFTKLQRSIITSSIWLEEADTRLVWITLLALCDRDGIARCSQRGLAHTARVSQKNCDAALRVLMEPDSDSRDLGDGRRVERVEGGFLILNYLKKIAEGTSEERREYFRDKQAESRARKKANGGVIRVAHRAAHRAAGGETPQNGPAATTDEVNRALRLSEDPPAVNGAGI